MYNDPYLNLYTKGVSTGAPPSRPSATSDPTSAVGSEKGAHARPECPSDGLSPRNDVRPDVRHCGEVRTSGIFNFNFF